MFASHFVAISLLTRFHHSLNLKSISPNDHDLLIPDCKCTRLPQLQVRPSVRRSSRFHQRSCTRLGPEHLGRSIDANSRYKSATTGAKCTGSVMFAAHNGFFRASSPHALRIRMTPTQNSRHQVAWHDVAVSRTQTFKQNIFALVISFPLPSCYRGWRNNNMMNVCPVRDAAIAAPL